MWAEHFLTEEHMDRGSGSPASDRPMFKSGVGARHHRVVTLLVVSLLVLAGVMAPTLFGATQPAGATPSTVTQTFGFDNDTLQNFTVPAGVTSMTVTLTGGQGSLGGADASGRPPNGGYQGEVTGTISVTPGEYLTIGVGSGADQTPSPACTGGADASSPVDADDAVGGINPLTQYDGGMGGAPGPNGCSGYGGAGGAATAIEVGSSSSAPTSVGTIIAGGGGGSGGSGQYYAVRGQISLSTYAAQSSPTSITYGIPAGCTTNCTSHNTIADPTPLSAQTTQGQPGIAVFTECGGSTGSNSNQYFNANAPSGEPGCDGGGGAGGGGGASGGAAGGVQFGSASSDEWYGLGGSPGQNSTGTFTGLAALDTYYSDADTGTPTGSNTFADPGSSYDGSVSLTYSTGVAGIPTGVSGTAGNANVALQWTAPNQGSAAISDYIIQYSSNGGSTWTTDDTQSTSTSATVTGLTNGTGYIFEVEAVNSYGDGPFSSPTGTLTPSGPPGAPTINSLTAQDGGLLVNFTAPTTSAPITGYSYQLNGSGSWYPVSGTTSPLTISGLTDGTSYSVEIEATNSVGTGAASNSVSGTPVALPGAPNITSVGVGSTTASVAFSPGSTGGSTITGYRYSINGGSTWTTISTTSPASLTGLTQGTNYTFELEAINVSGDSAPTSTTFTTTAPPSAPVITSIASQNQALAVTLTAPASNGSPITDYQWSTDAGTTWFSQTTSGNPCQTSGTSVTCEITALSTNGTTALTNGTPYSIEMRAVNAVGDGAASSSQNGTPYTTPGAPTISTNQGGMVAANQSLTVSFSTPANGGSAITTYQYSTDAGATWHSRTDGQTTSTTMTITALSTDGATALTNGTTYDVEIRAVNAAGNGPASAVATGIPVTAPSAPTVSTVTSENGALGVTFTPASNGGSAVTEYDYSTDNGTTWTTTGSLSSTFTIPNLTNGTTYSVEVRADNSVGDSSPSAPVSGTPATVPGQPVITSTIRGNATITVNFTPPSNGGSTILSYQYSTDAGATWHTAASTADPMVITALSTNGTTPISNGTEYPVEIRAVNAIGDSVASSAVEAAPATVPAAPTVTLTPGDGSISVAATVTDNGGSPVTGIDYSLDDVNWVSTGTTSSTFTVPSLTNGTSYTVWVRADNAIGDGTASTPESATPRTVPGAPTNVEAVSDTASADVSWTAPVSNGGSPITGYTATAYTTSAGTTPVGTACTTSTLACSVTGLTNGTTYYIGVVATNVAGSSIPSSPLQAVTPIARPGAPTLTSPIAGGDTYLSVSFTPGSAGGDPITSYQYALNGGTWTTISGTSSPFTINGLTDGTSYSVTLRAVSAAGPGASSTALSGTPYTYANPPTSIAANGENNSIVVSWAAPSYNGGSAITGYTITAFSAASNGTIITTCSTSGALTCTLSSSISNGTTYYISGQTQNAAGFSVRSTPRVAVTPSVDPGAVSAVTAVAGDGRATVSWTPGSTGQSAITNYTIWYSSGGAYTQFTQAASTSTTATVTGLTNGTPYTFEVYAVNTQGTGPASSPSNSVTPSGPSITSSVLPGGEIGTSYSATATATGGTTPYSWSVTNGSLPAGLVLNSSTGVVSGQPTANGTSTFTLVATDGVGGTATQSESVTITSAPSITSAALPGGEVGAHYSVPATATGGSGSYTWSITGGSLPAGLTLNTSTGVVSGYPTTSGTSTFTLVLSDGVAPVVTQSESVTITSAPSITSAALPGGEVGVTYSTTATATGGSGSYTWSITGGSLPAGLTLNTSTGVVSGSPTTSGTSTFTLVLSDGVAPVVTQSESVTIATAPSITSAALPGGEVGAHYSVPATATGGSGSYTWSITGGSLPAGLTLNTSTGVVSGYPTTSGTSTFTLVLSDGVAPVVTQSESVTITSAPSITSAALPGGEVGVTYSTTATATGGSGSYTWSITGGSLPAGLTLNTSTGVVSGSPTTSGTSTFTLVLSDGVAPVVTQSESVTIATAPSITSAALPGGEVGAHYSVPATATGGSGSYTWSITGGSLPAGLTLNTSTGVVSGYPTTSGTSTFTLVLSDGVAPVVTQSESVTITSAPSITSAALPGGEVGVTYSTTATATGGSGSYTWSITGGSLPAGLTLNTSTGVVSGSPTTSGTSTFTLVLSDGVAPVVTQSESVTIASDPSVTSLPLPGGEVGVSYYSALVISGGTGPFTWTAIGSLPAGLTLNPSTGFVSGIPTASGITSFTLRVTDAAGKQASQTQSLGVVDVPLITSPTLPGGEVGAHYAVSAVVTSGTGPFTWSVTSGTLPPGLGLDPTTGAVTGTPTTAMTATFTLQVTDAGSHLSTQPESVTIAPAPVVTGDTTLDGNVGAEMGAQLQVQGGTGPYDWALTSGVLPSGVVLSTTGSLSGVPADAGTFVATVKLTDARGEISSEPLTVVVTPTGLNSRLMAATPDGGGYWIATSTGAVTPYGDAHLYGSMAGQHLNRPVVGITATPDGHGYWLTASDGGVFTFGDAGFFGSMAGHHLNGPVVGITDTPDGGGYWLVASDGGVFSFGDAGFFGSDGSRRLNQPVVGIAATPDAEGYWLVASDGGVFTFGDARFFGSAAGQRLNRPVVGMAATADGDGYWLVAADGGVFTYGDAPFDGSEAGHQLNAAIGGIEAVQNGGGYWLLASDGGVFTFGEAGFMGSDAAAG